MSSGAHQRMAIVYIATTRKVSIEKAESMYRRLAVASKVKLQARLAKRRSARLAVRAGVAF